MDVRRRLSRFGSLSIILVLSLVVLAACGREENAKPTATPTGGAAVGTIEAPLGTTEAGGAEGTVEALASEANPRSKERSSRVLARLKAASKR